MLGRTSKKEKDKKGRGPTVFRGITAHAALLGVRREYLWTVLTGRLSSKSLMARYNQLVSCQSIGRLDPNQAGLTCNKKT